MKPSHLPRHLTIGRRTPLKRSGPLKRRRRRMNKTEQKAKELFDRAVRAKGPCVMGGECDGPLDAHHVIPKQRLKNHTPGFEALWDSRNGVPVCRKHHGLLTVKARRLSRDQLPNEVFAFAEDHALGWALDLELDKGFVPPNLDVGVVRPPLDRQDDDGTE